MGTVQLPLQYLARLHRNSILDNFTFIGNTGPLYVCSVTLAQLLSPAVSRLLSIDPTLDSFHIEVDNPEDFTVFRSLLSTGFCDISRDDICLCLTICQQLENSALIEQLFGLYEIGGELTLSNVVSKFHFYERYGEIPVGLIEYASTHFFELKEVLFSELEVSTLDQIFRKGVVVESEDSLFEFIKREIENRTEDCLSLLSHIELLYLTNCKMNEVVDFIETRGLTGCIWCKITELLRFYGSNRSIRPSIHTSSVVFEPGTNHFDGIFAYLKRETGSNCAVNGTIAVKVGAN
jgi:hypothetical protein